jgi:hypothetical protein
MLLSYLRAWSATQPGLESLAERVHRMLYIPADPLNPAATARYLTAEVACGCLQFPHAALVLCCWELGVAGTAREGLHCLGQEIVPQCKAGRQLGLMCSCWRGGEGG